MKIEINTINQIARLEGWGVYTILGGDNDSKIFIEKCDDMDVFESDIEAYKFVCKLAHHGSVVHQWAIAATDI